MQGCDTGPRCRATMQGSINAMDRIGVNAKNLFGLEFRCGEELRGRGGTAVQVDAVEVEGVDVDFEAKGRPKALDKVDGAGDEVRGRLRFVVQRCTCQEVGASVFLFRSEIVVLLSGTSAIRSVHGPQEGAGDNLEERGGVINSVAVGFRSVVLEDLAGNNGGEFKEAS